MIYLFCFLLNFLIIFFAIISWKFIRTKKQTFKVYYDIFYLIFIYNIFFHGILVDILRFFSDGKINHEYRVSGGEILEITIYESISNLIFLFFFLFFSTLKKNRFRKPESLNFQLFVLVFFSLGSILTLLLPGLFESALWFFRGSFSNMGTICSLVLLILSIKYKRKVFVSIAVLNILLIFGINIIAGLRGSIVGITIVLIIYAYIELPKYMLKKIALVSFFPIVIVILIGNFLGGLKNQFAINVSSKQFKLENIVDYYNFASEFISADLLSEASEQGSISKMLDEVEFRYGASSLFAVGFVRMYDRGYKASFQTEMNSFYSFLPRQIVGENKPVSGSINGTESGMGMYASYNEITGIDTVMSDFYVAGHYYWQFGILGVILLSIIASAYSFSMMLFSSKYNYVGHAFWLVIFKPFWLLPKLWFSEILIMISTTILPTIFLLFLLRIIYFLFKKKVIPINHLQKITFF